MIGDASRSAAAHAERLRIGQRHRRAAAVGLVDRVLRVDLHELRRRRRRRRRTRCRLSNVMRSLPLMTSAVCTARSTTVRPSSDAGEAHLVVAVGDVDLAELHREAPVVAQRRRRRPASRTPPRGTGPAGGCRRARRGGPGRSRTDRPATPGSGTPKNDANGGIEGCSDGGVRASDAVVLDLPVDLQELGVGQLPRRPGERREVGQVGQRSARRRGCRSGAWSCSVLLSSAKAGMTSRPNEAQALEHLLLGDLLVRVEEEVDEVDAGRLPLLQLADDLVRVADGDALGRLAGLRRARPPSGACAASRPGDG